MRLPTIIALATGLLVAAPALAEPTSVVVRAQSRDAKFIGTSMGGVAIRLTDVRSGKVLAEGLTEGGTGDTNLLMVQPWVRGAARAGEGAAAFTTSIDIEEPTLVRLDAIGPRGHPGSEVAISSTAWVLPGQPVVGDGWVVEFPGLVVDPVTSLDGNRLKITAKVTLMCGCPVTPGGLWDADHYRVQAWLKQGTAAPRAIDLGYAGEASTFAASAELDPKQPWSLTVTAFDARSGNAGVAVVGEAAP